jgi:hypothetical protein
MFTYRLMYVWVPVLCCSSASFFAHWVMQMCAHFIMSYDELILCEMGHPDVRWSIVSSYSLHSQHLLSVYSLRTCTEFLILSCQYCTSYSTAVAKFQRLVPLFLIHRFSSTLRGYFPCTLFFLSLLFFSFFLSSSSSSNLRYIKS